MLKRVYWDAGHDKSSVGAVGYVTEYNVNIKVVNYGCAYLESNYEVEVYKDISSDSITTICNRANNWGADLFISNHFNAFKPEVGDGFEALVYNSNSKELGKIFAKHAKAVGQNLRSSSVADGVKYRPDLGVLRLTTMPAVLNEVAFVDTWNDIKDWDEDHELKKMAEALAEAAAEYLNLPAKKKPATTSGKLYKVQVGAFANKKNADKLAKELNNKGYKTYIVLEGELYKVQVGAFANKKNADKLAKELNDKNYKTYIVYK